MMHYSDFNPLGKYPDAIKAPPVAYAFDIAGQAWARIHHHYCCYSRSISVFDGNDYGTISISWECLKTV